MRRYRTDPGGSSAVGPYRDRHFRPPTGKSRCDMRARVAVRGRRGRRHRLVAGSSRSRCLPLVRLRARWVIRVRIVRSQSRRRIRADLPGLDPGRLNGVTVLLVTPEGFDDLDTLLLTDYGTRFDSSRLQDSDRDGIFENLLSVNTCYFACAGGPVWTTTFAWNGEDYAPRAERSAMWCGHYDIWNDAADGHRRGTFGRYGPRNICAKRARVRWPVLAARRARHRGAP